MVRQSATMFLVLQNCRTTSPLKKLKSFRGRLKRKADCEGNGNAQVDEGESFRLEGLEETNCHDPR